MGAGGRTRDELPEHISKIIPRVLDALANQESQMDDCKMLDRKLGPKTAEDFRDSLPFQRDAAEMLKDQLELLRSEQQLERACFREYRLEAERREGELKQFYLGKLEAYREFLGMFLPGRSHDRA